MAGPKQPIDLLLIKGKKHLTKKEIEERKSKEVKAPSDKAVKSPSYLPSDLKKEFKKLAEELVDIGIMSNLDVDALARFLLAKKMYLQVTNELLKQEPVRLVEQPILDEEGEVIEIKQMTVSNETYTELLINQDKLFKQSTKAAADLGLTISSRCKLVIPKKEEEKPKSKEEKLFGDAL